MGTNRRKLRNSGALREKIDRGRKALAACSLCPRDCGVDRLGDEAGYCGTGRKARVASFSPHFGEEDVLVGKHGSGTIFFSSCNLKCCFCQNYDISFFPQEGREVRPEQLAGVMLDLQKRGCHNINFVSPSHVVVQILEALEIALENGLRLPLVYNSSGYDSLETLQLLEGVIDIYMPDFKFWYADSGEKYGAAPDYPEVARQALREMYRQVGDLQLDSEGVATSGLLVRHLLMPDAMAETEKILHFLCEEISVDTYVNIMDQYRPCGSSRDFAELQKTITAQHFEEAVRFARKLGLSRIDERDPALLLKRLGIL